MFEDGLSVIIPVYNSEKTIEKCLASICNQTYEKIQIICINDGSKDNSLRVLEKLQESDQRIEVYSQDNAGSSAARNNGIRQAKFNYITFVDSDDEIEPDMYTRMIAYLEENNLDCVACDMYEYILTEPSSYLSLGISKNIIIGKDSITEDIIKPLIGFKERGNDCLPSLVNKIFVTQIIKENNLIINEGRSYGEDWEFCINYFRHINSMGIVHEPFYHYIHWSKSSLMSKVQLNYLEMELDSQKKFRDWFPELQWDSPEQIGKLLNLPIRAAEYYRVHSKGVELHMTFGKIYNLCKSDRIFREYAFKSDVWKNLLVNKDNFERYIWKNSSKYVYICKIKRFAKRLLQSNG